MKAMLESHAVVQKATIKACITSQNLIFNVPLKRETFS
jgi:hypothetical protein